MTNPETAAMTADGRSDDIDQVKETDSFLQDNSVQREKHDKVEGQADHVNYKDYSLCARLKVDHPFRRRFIHTLFLFFAFIGLGWVVGLNGPTFPDLQQIVGKDLDTASWLFTLHSIGYLVGSFAGGILYDRCNKVLLLVFSIWLNTAMTALIPWCDEFALMLSIKFMAGLGCGGLDTGGNADLVSIWDQEGRSYMQAMHFSFGLGGIIAPLLAEPFLAKKSCLPSLEYNITNDVMTTTSYNISLSHNTSATPCLEVYGETNVHYAYIITAIIVFFTSIPFCILYVQSLRRKDNHLSAAKENQQRPDKLPRPLKILLLVLLATLMALYCAVEDTFAGFLMTFCINHLHWTKKQGSFATSSFWTIFSVGRFSGIFLIRFFTPLQLLCSFYSMLVLAIAALLMSTLTYSVPALWIFMAVPGYMMSVIFACIFTWTEESILQVTGMVSSLFLISASLGLMLNPMLVGYLMENYDTICFVYVLLAESFLGLCLLLVIVFLVKRYVKVNIQSTNMEMVVPVPEAS